MCLVLALIGGKEGFHALKDNVGVYQGYAPEQPIAFSHKIHAGQNGIDCVYCHHSAEKGKTSTVLFLKEKQLVKLRLQKFMKLLAITQRLENMINQRKPSSGLKSITYQISFISITHNTL